MNIIEVLSDLFIFHGTPEYIRSDNGSEFTANQPREWFERLEVIPTYNLAWKPLGKRVMQKF